MAVTKLICPECETVLRPAKPLAEGKKVKCPKCGITFAAHEADDDVPKKSSGKKKVERPQKRVGTETKAEVEKKTGMEYETNSYGVVWEKGDHDEEADKKAERGDELVAEYLKIKKTKDPRGPAQVAVNSPTNWLFITGTVGALGYVIVLLYVIILTFMPVTDPKDREASMGFDGKPKKLKGLMLRQGVATATLPISPYDQEVKKNTEEAIVPYLSKLAAWHGWIGFCLFVLLCLVGIGYGVVIVYGAVQAQNLASRGWGMASAILAMVPLNAIGFSDLTSTLARFVFDQPLVLGLLVLEAAWGVLIGLWCLKTMKDPKVIAGFEYDENKQDELGQEEL